MSNPIALLEAALYDTDQPDTRKTYGKVEYALIPVAVVEDVLTEAASFATEAEQPEPRSETLSPDAEAREFVSTVDIGALAVGVDVFPDDEANGDTDDAEYAAMVAAQEEE